MNIFRRKKSKDPVIIHSVNGMDLMQRFLLDSQISDAQSLSLLMGLTPMDDPDEEVALSNERVARAAITLPIIRAFSEGLSYSIVEFFRTHSESSFDDLTDQQAEILRILLDTVATSTALGTVTQLEHIGLIDYAWSRE